ncbi:hypothetical protein V8E36_001110 [Tilletia maclaganii]
MSTTTSPFHTSAASKKWPTSCFLSGDVALNAPVKCNNIHTFSATLFDPADNTHNGYLSVWSRQELGPGGYILMNAPFVPQPLQIDVTDNLTMRKIPQGMDGSINGTESLAHGAPTVSGIAVVMQVSDDKKAGLLAGFQWMGSEYHHFRLWVEFDSGMKWRKWIYNDVGSLVSFETVLFGQDVDSKSLKGIFKRVAFINKAAPQLLQALRAGQPGGISAQSAFLQKISGSNKRPLGEDDICMSSSPSKIACGSPSASGSASSPSRSAGSDNSFGILGSPTKPAGSSLGSVGSSNTDLFASSAVPGSSSVGGPTASETTESEVHHGVGAEEGVEVGTVAASGLTTRSRRPGKETLLG